MAMRPCQKQDNSTKLAPMDSACGVCAIDSRCDRHLASLSTRYSIANLTGARSCCCWSDIVSILAGGAANPATVVCMGSLLVLFQAMLCQGYRAIGHRP